MDAETVFASWIVCFLIGLAVLGRIGLNSVSSKEGVSKYYADESLSMRNVFELYVGGIRDLSDGIVGRKNTKVFFWFFGGLFLYILSNNFLGLLAQRNLSIDQHLQQCCAVTECIGFLHDRWFSTSGFGIHHSLVWSKTAMVVDSSNIADFRY